MTRPDPDEPTRAASAHEPTRAASARLSWGKRVYRALFRFYGPAQVGPPPYASEAELQRYRDGLAPQPTPTASAAPPGYRIVRYRDDTGTMRNTLVRDDGTPTPAGEADGERGPAED